MAKARIQSTLENTGIYTAYFDITQDIEAPYIVWRGSGQNQLNTDDVQMRLGNNYEVQYYYLVKDEAAEEQIETALIEAGFTYSKGSDMRDADTDEFLIIYQVNGYPFLEQ